jgi:hypothetical protein
MTREQILQLIKHTPETLEFEDVIRFITDHYHYHPTRFTNGLDEPVVINEKGNNEGSCKIFAFARLNQLNEQETLACFGRFYREDVVNNPEGTDHANIRTFIKSGWPGIRFDGTALTEK